MERELLHRFFDNRATRAEEEQILNWLDEDVANRRELLAERKWFDAVLLTDGKSGGTKRRLVLLPRWTKEVMKYAAVLLVAVGIGGYEVSDLRRKLLTTTNRVDVPAGQHVDLVLSDGTKVCMNALSQLEYPSFFAGDDRKVKLTGEAFFEVVHDASQPFVVETYACDVEVLGTHFDVEARPERGRFCTSLVKGSVRVHPHGDRTSELLLAPGQRVRYLDEQWVVELIPAHEGFRWRDGVLAFRNATFAELIAELELYYGVKIELPDPEIAATLNGEIRISEGLDRALRVLQEQVRFSYTRNAAKNVIYIE